MAPQQKKTKKKKSGSARTNNNWYVDSEEYQAFVAICEAHDAQNEEKLPRAGNKSPFGQVLDAFALKGLGDGRPAFTRDQLNRKFKHWKASLVTDDEDAAEQELQQLDETKVDTTEQLVERLKKMPDWESAEKETLVMFDDTTPKLLKILEEPLSRAFLDLRQKVIAEFNTLLSNDRVKGKQEAYTNFEENESRLFAMQVAQEVMKHDSIRCRPKQKQKDIRARVLALAFVLIKGFIDELSKSVKRGGHAGAKSIGERIIMAIDEFSAQDSSEIMKDTLLNRTIANTAGWLLSALQKYANRLRSDNPVRQILESIIEDCTATKEQAQQDDVPTGKIEMTITSRAGVLHYPSKALFQAVAMLEKVCERVLVDRSIKIFGSRVAEELTELLAANDTIINTVKSLADEDDGDDTTIHTVTARLVGIYMNMRTRDFVRHVMGMTRRSLTQGTRQRLAILSEMGQSKSPSMLFKIYTCYFCGEVGHVASKCAKMNELLAVGAESSKEVVMNVNGEQHTFIWHYCEKCIGWRNHNSEKHDDEITIEDHDEMMHAAEEAANSLPVIHGEEDGDDNDDDVDE